MRLLVTASIIVLGLAAYAVPRGASLISRHDMLGVSEVPTAAAERHRSLFWVGGAALIAVLALAVAARKRG